jgi:hypothetical protein
MGIFWKKQESVITKIKDYLETIKECGVLFDKLFNEMCSCGDQCGFAARVRDIHRKESQADDLKREIAMLLYKKALIPESRGDIMAILEIMDKIPGKIEDIAYIMVAQNIIIPDDMRDDIKRLADVNIEAFEIVSKAVLQLFYPQTDIEYLFNDVDKREGLADTLERALIEKIFKSPIDKADKLILKDLVVSLSDISDLAKDLTDRLLIAIVKRKI